MLTVDDDEIPGRALLDALPELAVADGRHALLAPAALALPDGRPVPRRPPWRPDYQPRLVLNDRRVLSFPDETHVPVRVLGPGRYLAAALYHADTLLNSRAAREAKARRYESLHPGKRAAGRPLNEAYYLPELVDPPTRAVPADDLKLISAVLGAPAPLGVVRDDVETREPGRGRPLLGRKAHVRNRIRRRLTLIEELPPLGVGTPETADVQVENRGDELWRWDGSVRLGSRWASEDGAVEGAHAPLPADLPPGGTQIVPFPLEPPPARAAGH